MNMNVHLQCHMTPKLKLNKQKKKMNNTNKKEKMSEKTYFECRVYTWGWGG